MGWQVENYKGYENKRLIKVMDKQGYNLRTLAEATGISERALWEIMKGRSFPRLDTILIICHTLETTIDSLYPLEL